MIGFKTFDEMNEKLSKKLGTPIKLECIDGKSVFMHKNIQNLGIFGRVFSDVTLTFEFFERYGDIIGSGVFNCKKKAGGETVIGDGLIFVIDGKSGELFFHDELEFEESNKSEVLKYYTPEVMETFLRLGNYRKQGDLTKDAGYDHFLNLRNACIRWKNSIPIMNENRWNEIAKIHAEEILNSKDSGDFKATIQNLYDHFYRIS